MTEMTASSLEETNKCDGEWKFSLLELDDSHYAAICIEDDEASGGAIFS
jgi:4'-phosphopantetheinyl transferase